MQTGTEQGGENIILIQCHHIGGAFVFVHESEKEKSAHRLQSQKGFSKKVQKKFNLRKLQCFV